MATEVVAAPGVRHETALKAAMMASLADETPEGRSIVDLALERGLSGVPPKESTPVPFSATTRLSGLDAGADSWRKGAVDAILKMIGMAPNAVPAEVNAAVDRIARSGGTPLAVTENGMLVGVIHLKDVVKAGVKERFADLRRMGIRTVMITGDNPVAAGAAISKPLTLGVDDFLAEATLEDKLRPDPRGQRRRPPASPCAAMALNDARRSLRPMAGGFAMQTQHPGRARSRQHGRSR